MKKYKCPECGWIGTEDEMLADYVPFEDGGELCSNYICPSCDFWHNLDGYIVVDDL